MFNRGTAIEPLRDEDVHRSSDSSYDAELIADDIADATEEEDDYTELIHSMSEFISEGELQGKAQWKLGYVPPLHLRLPCYSYGPQTRCSFHEVLSAGLERTKSMNSEALREALERTISLNSESSSGSADTRPIPASYYSCASLSTSTATSPANPPAKPPATIPARSSARSSARSLELLDYPLGVQTIESSKQPSSEYKSLPEATTTRKQRLISVAALSSNRSGPVSSKCIAANNMTTVKRRQTSEPWRTRYSCGLLAAGVR